MLLFTVVFTKEGGNPKENKYLQMVWIWLRFLQKYGEVQSTDRIFILADAASKEYLDQFVPYFPLTLEFTVVEIPTPSCLREGFLERFRFWNYFRPEQDEVVCYTDIDMVFLAPISWIPTICRPKTIYAFPEETIRGGNYLGQILEERDLELFAKNPSLAETHPGFTCTFFFFRGMFIQDQFQRLRFLTLQHEDTLYAPEQPFYNRILFDAMHFTPDEFHVGVLKKDLIEYNSLVTDCKPGTKLLNFCGEPGDQEFHWKKMFMAFLADT